MIAIESLLRDLAPQTLAIVIRRSGDFDLSEDAVQEALIAAAQHWPASGVPDQPLGWLVRTAMRRRIDQIRSNQARRHREETVARREPSLAGTDEAPVPDADDSLTLLFMCCHPTLTPASAIALTLRAVGGLTTAEIANAFLVPEATMSQRIRRSKQRISDKGVRFEPLTGDDRSARLRQVLQVLYLIFNEGYTSSIGPDLQRVELASEAIRLARMLQAQLPDDPEVTGLLALMLLTDARRAARAGEDGDLIPLDDQDRTLWDQTLITEGVALVVSAMKRGAIGEFQLQAAIAGVHDEAGRSQDTDWPQILALYGILEQMSGNPMVTLSRAVAAAKVHGPAAGLHLMETLDETLGRHYRLAAVRAHLYEELGDRLQALEHYRSAAARTTNLPEQRYLARQAARLHTGSDSDPADGGSTSSTSFPRS